LPNKIKYRTYDFRKYLGTNAWVVMATNFYEMRTGDDAYRQMGLDALGWIESYRDTDDSRPTYAGVAMGRVWNRHLVTDTLSTTYGFIDWDIFVAEHNFDAYSAYRGMGQLTGNNAYTETAELIKAFVLDQLWGPHVDLGEHPELEPADIENAFFPGINMMYPLTTPQGIVDTCIYLDGLSWSVLAFGPDIEVLDKDGLTVTLDIALDYAEEAMLTEDAVFFPGTCYEVTGVDGFRENDCSTNDEGLVWSEGSEGMVAAYYLAGRPAKARYYHQETASYRMDNGGVPYSNLPPNPSDPYWNWTDKNSIAGTAWFRFNEGMWKINPFQPWSELLVLADYAVFLPLVRTAPPWITVSASGDQAWGTVGPARYCNDEYKVALYAGTDLWYVQPYVGASDIAINPDCTWQSYTHPWDMVAAHLVTTGFPPPAEPGPPPPACPPLDPTTNPDVLAASCYP
jgi:hypothetical protein